MTGSSPCLALRRIRKRFGATEALAGVDLTVQRGEVHALIGENGAGKSTLMRILSGVIRPDAGEMELEGMHYTPASPAEARRAGIAMVNQELAVAPHLSVADNIVLGAEPLRLGLLHHAAVRRRAADALAELGRTDIPLDAEVGRLPVADRQLVEIARALCAGCRILVLDEPTSSLGRTDAARLFDLIRRLRAQGRTIVYISHFLEEVHALADRYTVLRDGRTVAQGETRAATPAQLAGLMVGRQLEELYARSPRQAGRTIMEVDGLRGKKHAAPIRFELCRGEILGLSGIVGAGRSELLRAIFALDPVRSGRVRLGALAGPASPLHRWRQGVGFVSEDRKCEGLALDLSVEENLTLPRLPRWFSPQHLAAECAPWIERLGIRCPDPGLRAGQLSGGNQQKVALARLLRTDSDVLLLDEPTRGIDIGAKQTIYRLIDELAGAGKAVLMVSSYLPELLGVCDRIAVMSRGVLGPFRPASEWDEHRIMLAATAAPHDR
ncbi:MAG: sugar ABC transporter ATP-binding protein [Opitutae bacterium]|nr:sugar ABC transporter ATP-binding protein [Opitutae bacterium]